MSDSAPTSPFGALLGEHALILAALARARAVAPTPATVLLLGETGTGKGLLARAIHEESGRERFVAVNCGALPGSLLESELFGHERGAFTGAISRRAGKFEAAAGGTIFLDEVDSLSSGAQVGLLRVLQDRCLERVGGNETVSIDARVIAATNRELRQEVAAGRFREDLFYRLNVVPIHLPPLRHRPDDIERLARHFVSEHAASLGRPDCGGLTDEVIVDLQRHAWPGNVRELENAVMRALILGEGSFVDHVDLGATKDPQTSTPSFDLTAPLCDVRLRAVERVEVAYLRGVMGLAEGDVDHAARHAQLSRRMFYQLLRRYGIRAVDFRPTTAHHRHSKEDSHAAIDS